MANKLFRIKSLAQMMQSASDSEHGLKRALTATNLVFIGIGCIVGTGIFVITGTAAAQCRTGPQHIFRHFCCTVLVCSALLHRVCFHDSHSRERLFICLSHYGEAVAWFIGWNLVLEYIFGSFPCGRRLVGLCGEFPERLGSRHTGID